MNFRVRDTTWFIAVGSSVLCFMLGLFAGFSFAGTHIIFANLILFVIALITVVSGAGLLLAAAETHAKIYDFKDNVLLKAHGSLYRTAMGEEIDSLSAHDIMDSLREDELVESVSRKNYNNYLAEEKAITDIPDKPVLAPKSVTTVPEEVFDNLAWDEKFEDEVINGEPHILTPQELLAKVAEVEEKISTTKVKKEPVVLEKAESEAEVLPGVPLTEETKERVVPNLVPIPYPKNKPTVHEEKPKASKPKFDIHDVIVIGEGGINPSSKEFKKLLEKALTVKDSGFTLKLKGKTYGLGARGVKTVQDDVTFVSFNKADIQKMLKKLNSVL